MLMDKAQLVKLGQAKINDRKSRQTAFEELKNETNVPITEIIELMRQLPPRKTIETLKVLAYILIGFLSMVIVIRISRIILMDLDWLTMSTIVSFINFILIMGVLKFDINSFRIVAIVSGASLFGGFPGVFKKPIDYSNLILFGMTALTIVLSYYLYKKLASNYKMKRELYTNELGQQRGRDVLYFED